MPPAAVRVVPVDCPAVLALPLVMGLCFAPIPGLTANLVPNPGFQTGPQSPVEGCYVGESFCELDDDFDERIDNWRVARTNPNCAPCFFCNAPSPDWIDVTPPLVGECASTVTGTPANTSSRCIRMNSSSTTEYAEGIRVPLNAGLQPGSTYVLQLRMAVFSNYAGMDNVLRAHLTKFGEHWHETGGGNYRWLDVVNFTVPANSAREWFSFSHVFTVPAGAELANLVLQAHYDHSSLVLVDDVSLQPCDASVSVQSTATAVFTGQTITLSASYSGPEPATFEWIKVDGPPVDMGDSRHHQDGTTLTITDATEDDAGTYALVVTTPCGNIQSDVAAVAVCSENVSIAPLSPTTILRHVHPYRYPPGSSVVIAAEASGPEPLQYFWYRGAFALNDTGRILGSRTSQLTIDPVLPEDAGDYYLEVHSDCEVVASNLVRVVVLDDSTGGGPRIATLDWLHDAFPFNDAVGLPGTAAFDTATALIKTGRNTAAFTGDSRRLDIPGDSLVACECATGVRLDFVFRIDPGPGNYVTLGVRQSGLRKLPSSSTLATAGDPSFWGQFLGDNGPFGTPGGHSGGVWNPNVWNSARMDSAERNLWPVAGRGYDSELDPCVWSATYHEQDPKYATLGVAKGRCFLIDPNGPMNSGNITCDLTALPSNGWELGAGYVAELGLPYGLTFEHTKIIPDGLLTPGSHVQYFIRRSSLANPEEFRTTPDTNRVTLQPDEVNAPDACLGVGPGNTDGHRWQGLSVLPDRWKAPQYGGLGSACMLYIDNDDGHGDERAWVTASNLIGATHPGRFGAHNGWHVSSLSEDPDHPSCFVSDHRGQAGTKWDMFGVRGVSDPFNGYAGSIGSRYSPAGSGLTAGKEARIGPTTEMLSAYYSILYMTTGRFDHKILGPFVNRGQDDVAILQAFKAGTTALNRRGLLVQGASFAEAEESTGNTFPDHLDLLHQLLGTDLRSSSYPELISPSSLACASLTTAFPGEIGVYGLDNAQFPENDVLDPWTGSTAAVASSHFQPVGSQSPYVAGTRMTPTVGSNWIGQLDAWDIQDLQSILCLGIPNGRLMYLFELFRNGFGSICSIVGNEILDAGPQAPQRPPSGELRLLANPVVRGAATISLQLPLAGDLQVEVFDLAGRRLRRLASGFHGEGEHTLNWDRRNDDGVLVRAGLYFVRARIPGTSAPISKSLVVLE